eukprot:gene8936-10477_t
MSFNIVVLISGSGTNLQAIINAVESKVLDKVSISAVISNKDTAYGLTRAQNAGIPTRVFSLQQYLKETPEGMPKRDRSMYGGELAKLVREYNPKLVVLAGFMLILTPSFLNEFEKGLNGPIIDIINLHPALPGQFAGAHAIKDAFEAFQRGEIKHTGLMIHKVIEEIDAGEVVLTANVEIVAEDTMETLEERMHKQEHITLVQAIKNISEGITLYVRDRNINRTELH